jgi:hypothetical protein
MYYRDQLELAENEEKCRTISSEDYDFFGSQERSDLEDFHPDRIESLAELRYL